MAAGALCAVLGVAGSSQARQEVGRVTMMAGAPRMVGESIRPLQPILSGRMLETGDADAAGVMVEDLVFHIGPNSQVAVHDEPGGKRFVIEQGYVVLYADAGTRATAIVETPFGRLTFSPELLGEGGSGWYSVRHDPQQSNVKPAVSTFAAMEGPVEVAGTAPQAGPYLLKAGQRWRIVQGQMPGPPEEGDERVEAEALRDLLHRQTAELVRVEPEDLTRLALADLQTGSIAPETTIIHEGQLILDGNAANQHRSSVPPTVPPALVNPEPPVVLAVGAPARIAAGTPNLATAQFVSYPGTPANADFNAFLTSVQGDPAFQPRYLTQFANGGFSYIQLAGPDAQLVEQNGETFLAGPQGATDGWALFTPLVATGDAGFDAQSGLVGVVSAGFRAIAQGEHLSGGGSIGGDGLDPASGFAGVFGGQVQLNPNQPVGYPLLDRAADVTGLTVGGQAVGDQIAALGAGLDPQQLGQSGPQLLFLSNASTDANGNGFNFDGAAIAPTELNLPSDRQVLADTNGSAGVATPLSADPGNTVGIQFAATGQTIAIVHHTGLRNPAAGSTRQSEHFEVVRGTRSSVIRWRSGGRVTGAGGVVLEFEDIGADPALRNELFTLLCSEVNSLTPVDTHTVCGPAVAQPGSANARLMRRAPGTLVRTNRAAVRRGVTVRGLHTRAKMRAVKSVNLRPAGGRLIVGGNRAAFHRHLGRVTPTR
ncbi:MAG: hypothetical protein ACE5E5_11100 [Phycisphaerae bacterium]